MPLTIDTNNIRNSYGSMETARYQYEYPEGLDLRPRTWAHERIKNMVLEHARMSHERMKNRFGSWDKIDQTLTAYIRPDDEERAIKNKDERKPVSIVVPLSYATLETLLTYWVATFLELPYFRYKGVGPEDTLGAILLEKLIEHQSRKGKIGLALHTQFRDALAYGFGASTPIWTRREGWRTVRQVSGYTSLITGQWIQTGEGKARERAVLYEGHVVDNIDPRRYLPDTNYSIHDPQRGEFVGWIVRENYLDLLNRERNPDAGLFNVRYCQHIDGRIPWLDLEGKRDRYSVRDNDDRRLTKPMETIWMYRKLIPKEFGLGKSDRPEKWLFGLAGGEVVIAAQPLGLDHDLFPVNVCAPEYDGYSAAPISKLEVVHGLQEVIDFMFNSHVTNVRKALNDMWLVDPSIINIHDMKSPEPGKLIRVKPEVFGRGVQNAIQQFPVNDVTRANIADSAQIADWVQRVSGAVDMLQGMVRTGGERRSAEEVRNAKMAALSRLQKQCKVAGLQSIEPLAEMIASQTIQLCSESRYVAVAGRWEQLLREEYGIADPSIRVSPLDLLVDVDVDSGDYGSGQEFSDQWERVMQTVGNSPELSQRLDTVRIFMHWARLTGARNLEDFRRKTAQLQPAVMGDEAVAQQVQAGNLIPMGATA